MLNCIASFTPMQRLLSFAFKSTHFLILLQFSVLHESSGVYVCTAFLSILMYCFLNLLLTYLLSFHVCLGFS